MSTWTRGKRLALLALVEVVALLLLLLVAVTVIPRVAPPPSVATPAVPGDVIHTCPRTLRPCQ